MARDLEETYIVIASMLAAAETMVKSFSGFALKLAVAGVYMESFDEVHERA